MADVNKVNMSESKKISGSVDAFACNYEHTEMYTCAQPHANADKNLCSLVIHREGEREGEREIDRERER